MSNDKTTIQPGEALTEASLEAWCEKVAREHPKRCRHGLCIELVYCWECGDPPRPAARLTDRCTWWHCARPGSILFTQSEAEVLAHLCETHAGLFARRPDYWRNIARNKLLVDPPDPILQLIDISVQRDADGVLHVELPGTGWE